MKIEKNPNFCENLKIQQSYRRLEMRLYINDILNYNQIIEIDFSSLKLSVNF